MQTRDETFDDLTRNELETAERRQLVRLQQIYAHAAC